MNYTITLKSSNHSFTCKADETILDAALRQGVALTTGCRRGICGVCIGTLHSGRVNYLNDEEPMAFFTLDEKDVEEGQEIEKIVICEAMPSSDLILDVMEIDAPEGLEHKNLPANIIAQNPLSEDIVALQIDLPEDEYLQFLPGQNIALVEEDGTRHLFSLADAPRDGKTLTLHINTQRSSLDLTTIHQTCLRLEGPQGEFFLHSYNKKCIFICEKEGFAAIKSMMEHMISRYASTQQEMPALYIYWLGESDADIYQHQLVEKWSDKYSNIRFLPIISSQNSSDNDGNTAKLLALLSQQLEIEADYDLYISATANTVDILEFELLSLQINPPSIYYQRF